MSSPRTALRERVAALGRARRAIAAGRLDDAEVVLVDELDRWPGNRDAQALLAEVTRAKGGTPGVRPAGRREAAAPGARASNAEAWSTFEQRVRERRIARCAERARAAVEAGDSTAALASIEEIETLAPDHPVLEHLEGLLREHGIDVQDARQRPAPVEAPPDSPLDATQGHDPAPAAHGRPGIAASFDTPADPVSGEPPAVVPAAEPPAPVPPLEQRQPSAFSSSTGPADDPLHLFAPTSPVTIDDVPLRRLEPHGIASPGYLDAIGTRPDVAREAPPPLRERGTHVLGIVLLVLSVLALSGWLGYRLFRPVVEVPIVPAAGTVADESPGLPQAPPAPATPPPDDSTAGTTARDTGAPADSAPPPEPQPPPDRSPVPPPTSASNPAISTPPPPSSAAPRDSRSSTDTDRAAEGSARAGEPAAAATTPAPEHVQTPPTPEPQAPASPRTQVPGSTEAPPVAAPAPAAAAPPASEPAAASPAASSREASSPSAGETTPDASTVSETSAADAEALRGLIEGYVAGYNNLDAGGVRSVWPGVDERALARAFTQLRSQRFAFSRCEVRASGDAGHGFCTGRATWRPRVGGGERTERRVWRFDFEQRGGRWTIGKVAVER